MARKFVKDKKLDISHDELNHDGKMRANRSMSEDLSWSPRQDALTVNRNQQTTFRDQFDIFCRICMEWSDLSNVFSDDKAIADYLVIRLQKSGICFLHAVAVVQHYVSCKRTGSAKDDHEVIYFSWYIREQFPKERLTKSLTKEGGGSSFYSLCEIANNPTSKVMTSLQL